MTSYQIAKIFGIPIRAHITLVILLPLFAVDFARALHTHSLLWGLLAAVGLFASVALHELGHSVVAIRKHCRVREILLLPIGGVAQLDQMPSRPRDEFQMAIAGPLVSAVLAVLGWFGGSAVFNLGFHNLGRVLSLLGGVNLMLFLFNLLPSFPMDGGRIFRSWLTPRVGRLVATGIAAKIGRFMALVFGVLAVIHFNLFLLLIAIFIYQAAGAEYRMVRIQEASRGSPFATWTSPEKTSPYQDGEIEVGPPPYRTGRTSTSFVRPIRAQHDLFDDLFQKWRW